MNSLHIPGFTAEASISKRSIIPSIVRSANQMGSAVIVPQLKIYRVPCWYRDRDGWRTCDIPYDDPGGWGISPGLGDVWGRQCVARCNRISDPIRRADCLDVC